MGTVLLLVCVGLLASSVCLLIVSVGLRLDAHREAKAVERDGRREIARLKRKLHHQASIIIRQSNEIDDLRDVRAFIDEVRSLPTN